jgi:hypothetical protein
MVSEPVEQVNREQPRRDAPEKEAVTERLDFLRATAVNKVAGLSDDQALGRAVEPSELSPGHEAPG